MEELKKKIAVIIGNALVNHGVQVPRDIVDEIISLISKTESGATVPCNGVLSLRDCDCEGWKEYLPILNSHTVMSSIRGATHTPYPEEGVFLYCPWCGKKR